MRTYSIPSPIDTALLETATSALSALGVSTEVRNSKTGKTEAVLRFGNATTTFAVAVKRIVNSANLGAIAHRLTAIEKPLLVTEYVATPVAERLRAMDIPFIDSAGNAFVQAPPMLVWITGRKPEKRLPESRVTRAFQPGGLKQIFALLCQPELTNAAYRDIAAASNVALGTVGWVMRDLKQAGYLIDLGKRGRKLVNRRKLLEQWADGYAQQLRPKLLIGRFRSLTPNWPQDKGLAIPGVLWGGETAAAKLTGYLKPGMATMYLPKDANLQSELMNKLRLVKDATGNVELRQKFWNFDSPDRQDTVPPLLAYADLLATADDRNIETAGIIYDKHLARLIENA